MAVMSNAYYYIKHFRIGVVPLHKGKRRKDSKKYSKINGEIPHSEIHIHEKIRISRLVGKIVSRFYSWKKKGF
jgi:hypothetical protein